MNYPATIVEPFNDCLTIPMDNLAPPEAVNQDPNDRYSVMIYFYPYDMDAYNRVLALNMTNIHHLCSIPFHNDSKSDIINNNTSMLIKIHHHLPYSCKHGYVQLMMMDIKNMHSMIQTCMLQACLPTMMATLHCQRMTIINILVTTI